MADETIDLIPTMCRYMRFHYTFQKRLARGKWRVFRAVAPKELLIKSGFNQQDTKKWEDHFLEVTKNAHFTGEINSPYSRFLGLLLCESPQEALNQCFPDSQLEKLELTFVCFAKSTEKFTPFGRIFRSLTVADGG